MGKLGEEDVAGGVGVGVAATIASGDVSARYWPGAGDEFSFGAAPAVRFSFACGRTVTLAREEEGKEAIVVESFGYRIDGIAHCRSSSVCSDSIRMVVTLPHDIYSRIGST